MKKRTKIWTVKRILALAVHLIEGGNAQAEAVGLYLIRNAASLHVLASKEPSVERPDWKWAAGFHGEALSKMDFGPVFPELDALTARVEAHRRLYLPAAVEA